MEDKATQVGSVSQQIVCLIITRRTVL